MTKTIEFVSIEIENQSLKLADLKRRKAYYEELEKIGGWIIGYEKEIDNINLKIEDIEFNLKYMKQIKTELEAWEMVKPAVKSKLRVIGKYRDKIIEVNHREYNEGTTEYQALKKALEVEDE